ncbi:MAG TPA: aminotransferase class I/II-fold pyridoxal phosphate-dependent enzyme [Dehalococcoidia bacterium]|nr:aminotransferase class I/II-fold pyridoxal phosphate-dependent enzyme [Dehalococcoidia bacterium]
MKGIGKATSDARKRPRYPISERVRQIPASGIRRFFDLLASIDGVISLGVGEPDFVTPWTIREAAIHSITAGQTMYTSNYGTLELRTALARHLEKRYGVAYDPLREILITVGVSEALDLAMRALLDPVDEVLVPDPCYVSYVPCVVLAGGTPVSIPTGIENDFRLLPEDMEPHITSKTKLLLLGYPSNPTGAIMSRDDLLRIAEVAEQHDLLVISDEIYDRLVYETEHTCVASLPGMRERTVLLGGFSKSYAMTGWRIGYAAAPAEIIEAMMKVHQYVAMCASTMSQAAALEALRRGEDDVQEMREEYDRRRRYMVTTLNEMGLRCFNPRGAFYAFPSIQITGLSSDEFAERLLVEEKVAVVPGSAFGSRGEGFVRCCYATSMEEIREALNRMARFVERHRAFPGK